VITVEKQVGARSSKYFIHSIEDRVGDAQPATHLVKGKGQVGVVVCMPCEVAAINGQICYTVVFRIYLVVIIVCCQVLAAVCDGRANE